jgi:hypothetical protein
MSNADTPTTEAKRIVPALHPRFFQGAEYVRTHYTATIPAGIKPEDLCAPTFWSHISGKLRPWDHIECIAEDGAFYAELLVRSATSTDANVILLNKIKLDAVRPGEAELLKDYEVSHTPATQWRVLRKSDRRELTSGLKSRDEAIGWISTNRPKAAA